MKQLYFRTVDADGCFELEYHLNEARNEWLTEIDLYEALPDQIPGHFWCQAFSCVGEDGDCGKRCPEYDPINGQRGKCKSKGKFYIPGNMVTFKVPELKIKP